MCNLFENKQYISTKYEYSKEDTYNIYIYGLLAIVLDQVTLYSKIV